jgi:hypothetical protein
MSGTRDCWRLLILTELSMATSHYHSAGWLFWTGTWSLSQTAVDFGENVSDLVVHIRHSTLVSPAQVLALLLPLGLLHCPLLDLWQSERDSPTHHRRSPKPVHTVFVRRWRVRASHTQAVGEVRPHTCKLLARYGLTQASCW